MSNETTPAVANNTGLEIADETALVVDGDHGGFTEDDASGGMSPVMQSYVKSYPYFLRSDNGTFELRDNNAQDPTKEVIWTGPSIPKAILYLGHHTKTLRRGDIEGLETDPDSWTDEQKELVAISYNQTSNGNFILNGFGEYLRKPLRDKVSTRLYVFAVFPELPSKLAPVACSFGITADSIKKPGSFSNLRLAVEKILLANKQPAMFPLQYLMCELGHVPDKDASGKKSYHRVTFALKKVSGAIVTAFESRAQYMSHPLGYRMWDKIKKTHDAAVKYAESGQMAMGLGERTVSGITDNSVHAPEPFSDEIPFP